jgi:hypothetical protein
MSLRILAGLVACMLYGAQASGQSAEEPIDTVNYFLGTQTIGVRYGFTDKTRLVETAQRIRQMGSNVLKIALNRSYCAQDYSLPKRDDVASLVDLVRREPSFRAVLDMPFAYYVLWAYPFAPVHWRDGLTDAGRQAEYREMYDLSRYLLDRYAGSGKTFFLGHWEGDWHLLGGSQSNQEPSPQTVRGMIDWLNVRQQAIDDAQRDALAKDVRLFHYTEVNLVQKGLKGGTCVTRDVLPHTRVDYVSYSCYDTINAHRGDTRAALFEALDYIESKLAPKPGLAGKRVFLGEFGFPLEGKTTPDKQDLYSRDVCRSALEWGCPLVLYWEMYCNEVRDGRHRGFWLIDDHDRKQPYYFTLEDYYRRMKARVAAFREEHRRGPTAEESRGMALEILARPGVMP